MEIKIVIDDRIVELAGSARRLLNRKRVALLVGAGAVVLGSLAAAGEPVIKPYTFTAGTTISASEVNANFDRLYEAVEGRIIRDDTTIDVVDCDDLETALDDLHERRIARQASVMVRIAAGTHACAGTVSVEHPDGDRLAIVGGGADRSDVVLTFPSNVNGIYIGHSHALGWLNNLTLQGPDSTTGSGVSVDAASSAIVEDIAVMGFSNGVGAVHGSFVMATNVLAEDNSGGGISCSRGSSMRLASVTARNNYAGFRSTGGAHITSAGNLVAEANLNFGFWADSGGMMNLASPVADNNGNDGFYVNDSGVIVVGGTATISDNQRFGINVSRGAHINFAATPTYSGNATNTNTTNVGRTNLTHTMLMHNGTP